MSRYAAEHFVQFIAPNGKRWRARIAIGAPERIGPDWGCRVIAEGVSEPKGPIYGATPLQALALGLRLLASVTANFVQRGGRILAPHDDTEAHLDRLFGPLWPQSPS